ncbi:MAG: hypothetical protein JWQ42_3986 [Edaphobacter sp.]|nr:hypothetical protein [Edaphobacter sp.]
MKHAIATQTEHIAGFSFVRCRYAIGMELFSNGLELYRHLRKQKGGRKASRTSHKHLPNVEDVNGRRDLRVNCARD